MTTLKFSEIAQKHPLLQTDNLDGVLTYWPQHINTYLLARYMPLVTENKDKIEMDVQAAKRGGMTPMVAMDAEAPIYDQPHGRGKVEFEAASFREKVKLGIQDLYDLRRIGTRDELMQARRLMKSRFEDLEYRLLNRMENLRKQVLFDGEVRCKLPNGQEFVQPYKHPSYLEPELSGTDLFSDYANSDPVPVLQDIIEDYEMDTGRTLDVMIFPHGMMNHLLQNDKFRDLAMARTGMESVMLTNEQTKKIMLELLGVGTIIESKDFIHYQTALVADAVQTATSLELFSVEDMEVGDLVYIVSQEDFDREKFEVTAINGTTVTIDQVGTATGGVQRAGGFKTGDSVKYQKRVIPEDTILMLGSWNGPLNQEGVTETKGEEFLNRWAEVVSTRSLYADLENPKPGVYTKSKDNLDGDPPHIEQILGIRALPRVNQNDAWLTLKAL
jgi:hypothetical protein